MAILPVRIDGCGGNGMVEVAVEEVVVALAMHTVFRCVLASL